jgi:hypothetical protein
MLTALLPFLFTVLLLAVCNQAPEESPPLPSSSLIRQEARAIPFSPPADSLVSVEQLRHWIRCNRFLDSLSLFYADSFKTDNPARLQDLQTRFVQEQEQVCIRAGLRGGYEEYLWILENIGHPRNAAVRESVGTLISPGSE